MVARIRTVAFQGIEAVPVEAQVTIAGGLPAFTVVGLPDKAVGESRERVRAALTAMGLALPAKRITVNLAPADLLKEGSHFDLPIALGLLAAMGVLPAEELERYVALGELALDGSLLPVAGVLPAALGAAAAGRGLICPRDTGGEAAWAGKIDVLAQRLPGLLPPLAPDEALEVSMIHSVAGLLHDGRLMRARPFRDPHHSASLPALVGGGMRGKPSEISLAHLGVLFLDELPERFGIR